MHLHRRDFLKIASLTGLSILSFGQAGFGFSKLTIPSLAGDTILEEAIRARIYEKLKKPVVIQTVELVRTQGELFVRVVSKDGATGITQCNDRMNNLGSLLNGLAVPFFTGKDARDIVFLTEEVYRVNSNYKYAGMPFWNCVGHVEIAVWDLLGKTAATPVHRLLGEKIRSQVPVYLSSLTRETTPEQEAEQLGQKLAETGAKAIKIKVGGRMRNTPEDDRRSRLLIPALRKQLGDGVTIYADANSSYTV
ncbi:MAG: mandelate racemase/muconate lactonizing enzyme family protein, partial [Cytophagales bacterium]|nr:mandelate racemase/muconate lactonizing enzyme family protein [Cytophagales bacterium]